jgi:hypothetical protein
MEVSGQLHALAALPQRKNLRFPLDIRVDGPQNRSERGDEGKIDPAPAMNRTPVVQLVA